MIGQTVGNYRVVRRIGEGGMGVVYLAEHPGIGRKAAVKVLHASLAEDPEVVTRFFNEARAANAIRHAGIVEVFDFGTLSSGAPYIIMEFLEGESLAARIERLGQLPVADALVIAQQAASVLAAAHDKGIVHRDLKPDNLFLVPDLRSPGDEIVKVLDFGIAKLNRDAAGSGSVKTRTGTVMGTPLYMSPEQCRGTREVDHRTDIYALGIILYEMLCGQPPFVSTGHGELIHMHIAAPPPSPRERNSAVSEVLEAAILRTLAKDPAARFASMTEFAQALKKSQGSAARAEVRTQPYQSPRPAPGERPARPSQTTFSRAAGMVEETLPPPPRRGRVAVAVVGLLAALGVGGFALLRLSQSPSSATAPVVAPPPAAVAASVPTVPAVEPPAKAAPAAAEAPPRTIAVAISSEPAGARVVRERDGADIGLTPFNQSWPAGSGLERVRVELRGYRDESFVIPLDRGISLSFALTPVPVAPRPKKKPAEPHRPASSPPVLPPIGAPPAAPPPAGSSPAKAEPVPL